MGNLRKKTCGKRNCSSPKNEALLPFKENEKIALLGAGAVKTVKGGIGSGDVNNRENISIYEGLKEAKVTLYKRKVAAGLLQHL